jgi:hypothetical protein
MKTKILKSKILQRKFPAIQQNHQNSIIHHETIPLIATFSTIIFKILQLNIFSIARTLHKGCKLENVVPLTV